eukprot:6211942-Pleurochrysis_carterae.AAC.1
MGDAIEPEPMQADLPMLSDPGAPASFKDIANISEVNERYEWYRAYYAEIVGLFDVPAGLRLVSRPRDLTMILQLRTLYKIKADGRKKAGCVLGGHRQEQSRDFKDTFSPTVKHTTLRNVLAVAAERDLDVQGLDVTQA